MDYTTVYTRICKTCEDELPATEEYFPRSKAGFLGIAWVCKKCRAIERQEYCQKTNLAAQKKYAENNPEKRRAHYLVRYEVVTGRMKPVTECLCACGQPAEHYHHEDYSQPLDVVPLCRTCHGFWHRD